MTSGCLRTLETAKPKGLGREGADIKVGCILPMCQIKNVSLHSSFVFWTSLLNSHTMKAFYESFVHHLPCSGLERQCHFFLHISGHCKGGNPTCKCLLDLLWCWWSFIVLLITYFSLYSNASVSLEQTQSPVYCVILSNPGGLLPYVWLTTPSPGKFVSRHCT